MNYQLTPQAEEDLKQIARYTVKKWGKKQSLKYAGLLEACFLKITNRSVLSRSFSEHYSQVQVTRCEHHYVFYVDFKNKQPCIIAVLHEAMDIVSRLKSRLDL